MATKALAITLVSNEEDWLNILARPSLLVLDIHSKWSGPCEALTSTLRKLVHESHEKVEFVHVVCDTIPELQAFRDNSLPQFLVYIRHMRLAHVVGANAPFLVQIVKEKLELEAKGVEQTAISAPDGILNGVTRKISPTISKITHEGDLEQTLALIKPDAMAPSSLEAIIDSIKTHRFNILEQKKVWLTKEQAEEFYTEHRGKPFFDTLCGFLSSSPIMALRISKENAIQSLRLGAGPSNPNRARTDAPRSIRATYGTDNTMNAIYASDSPLSAATHLALFFAPSSTIHQLREDIEKQSPVPQKTVVIIKPGYTDEVVGGLVQRILWKRWEIVKREEVILTQELASQVYARYANYDYFNDLIAYVTSGPSLCFVVKGENAVHDMKLLLGERDPAEARKTLPMSFRALFGKDSIHNTVDCSKTADEALHQMVTLFPGNSDQLSRQVSLRDLNSELQSRIQSRRGSIVEYPTHIQIKETAAPVVETVQAVQSSESVETSKVKKVAKQTTLALIKPDAFDRKDQIISRLKLDDFTIIAEREVMFTRELAEEFYAEHKQAAFFEKLIEFMISSPVYALALEKEAGITAWRDLAGPTNSEKARESAPISAMFGTDGTKNAVHGSDSPSSATREINLLFNERTLALIKPDAYDAGHKDAIMQRLTAEGFRILLQKECVIDLETAKELYKEHQGSAFFDGLVSWMAGASFYAIICEKGLAVSAWRALVGPTDPEKARETEPTSMRALYGTNIAYNACHGSESSVVVEHEIALLFTPEELNPPPPPPPVEVIKVRASRSNLPSRAGSKLDVNAKTGSNISLSKSPVRNSAPSRRQSYIEPRTDISGSSQRLGGSKLGSRVDMSPERRSRLSISPARPSMGSLAANLSNPLGGSGKIGTAKVGGSKIELRKVASRVGSKQNLSSKLAEATE